jgi:hypothetical protein
MTERLVFGFLCLLAFTHGQASGAMRCDSDMALIDKGSSKTEVLQRCGKPDQAVVVGSDGFARVYSNYPDEYTLLPTPNWDRGVRDAYGTWGIVSETWYYNCGGNRFTKRVVFSGRVVEYVEDGDRGSGPSRCS